MTDSKAQAAIEPSKRPGQAPRDDATGAPPLGRRMFRLRNVASFLLALVALYLVYRQLLGLDREEVWTNIQGANVWLFALAFAAFCCSFPVRALRRKVLRILIIEDGGKTGQLLEHTRRRLTLGFVGIFALILVLVCTVLVTGFRHEVNAQQDELLAQKADAASTYMRDVLLPRDGKLNPGPPPGGPIQESAGSDVGVLALVPPASSAGSDGTSRVLDSSSSASSFGLPFEEQAQKAAQEGATTTETVQGPEGEAVRVVSVPVRGHGGEVGVVQAAQFRRVAWDTVRRLILVAVPVGLGGLLLAGIGGLYMSRRAMQPVRAFFQRQRTFVADASHELKTPLALLKIHSEVLRRNVTDPEDEEIVEDQLSEIERMDALLSDLLALARLDAGRLEVADKPFDLATVAAETAGRFLTRAADEGVQLEVEVPDDLPVHGDPNRTEQILAVLLDNAIRYTPKGGTITVSGQILDGRVEVSVEDTGPGIAPEHLPHIFDRFYRAGAARTRKGGGTGLGLSIARGLARAQRGDLVASNAPGGGASLTLRLPAGSS